MIYIEYLVVAAIVVFLSIKASNYVDLLDKNTNLSGAFLGGIMLSAVTSLPELFTSISATLLVHKPGLCVGNILGSDLFNLVAISVIILIFFKGFARGRVAKSYRYVTISVFIIYGLVALNFLHILDFTVFTLSITSIGIIAMYVIGARHLATVSDIEADEDAVLDAAGTTTDLSIKQIVFRFILASIGIIAFSIIITYITDDIAVELNLGAGLAGAIFLGVATSLPELASTISLFRLRNYDIAVGNIIGSNLFNFIILAFADIITITGPGVYDNPDPKNFYLLFFGALATPLFWIMLKFRNKITEFICPVGIIGCYLGFLLI